MSIHTLEMARQRADASSLPTGAPTYRQSFAGVKRVQLGSMLADASIVTHDLPDTELCIYGQSTQPEIRFRNGVLSITAPLPYTQEHKQASWVKQVLRSGSSTTIQTGGDHVEILKVDELAVDLTRRLRFVIRMPATSPSTVTVDGPYGIIGIDCQLDTLEMKPSFELAVFATGVRALTGALGPVAKLEVVKVGDIDLHTDTGGLLKTGDVAGDAKLRLGSLHNVQMGHVGGNLILTTDGASGHLDARSVAGSISIKTDTFAEIKIAGGESHSLTAKLGTNSHLVHSGSVAKVGRLDFDPLSTAVINGHTHSWSPFGDAGGPPMPPSPPGAPRAPRPPRMPRIPDWPL